MAGCVCVSIGPPKKRQGGSLVTRGKKDSVAMSHFCSDLDVRPTCALPLCVPITGKKAVQYPLNDVNSVSETQGFSVTSSPKAGFSSSP